MQTTTSYIVPNISSNGVDIQLPDISQMSGIITEFPDQNVSNTTDPDPNNDWYLDLEHYILDIGLQSRRYCTIHTEISNRYNSLHEYVTLLIITIPFLVSIISLVPLVFFPSGKCASDENVLLESNIFHILAGILGLIGTMFGSLNKMMRYSDKAIVHRIAANKFIQLNSSIIEQLFLPVSRRFNGIKFERWCRSTFFNIKEVTPNPNEKKFNCQHKLRHLINKTSPNNTVNANNANNANTTNTLNTMTTIDATNVPMENNDNDQENGEVEEFSVRNIRDNQQIMPSDLYLQHQLKRHLNMNFVPDSTI